MRNLNVMLTLAATLAVAVPLQAQGRDRDDRVPPGQRPPAGMCRIWIDGVPPGRQPRPMSCAAAERNVPRNGRIIFSDGRVQYGRYSANTGYQNYPVYPSYPGGYQTYPSYPGGYSYPRNDPNQNPGSYQNRTRTNTAQGQYGNGQYGNGQYNSNGTYVQPSRNTTYDRDDHAQHKDRDDHAKRDHDDHRDHQDRDHDGH
jgi:hypothetical protein